MQLSSEDGSGASVMITRPTGTPFSARLANSSPPVQPPQAVRVMSWVTVSNPVPTSTRVHRFATGQANEGLRMMSKFATDSGVVLRQPNDDRPHPNCK